jgi:hypothetical protein
MSASTPGQTVFSIGYDFHAGNGTAGSGTDNGNVYGIYNYRDRSRDQSFTYDALNRLASASARAVIGDIRGPKKIDVPRARLHTTLSRTKDCPAITN